MVYSCLKGMSDLGKKETKGRGLAWEIVMKTNLGAKGKNKHKLKLFA